MVSQDKDLIYMERAFELAKKGRGSVAPNPMVGCVIVKDDEVIGEGWHKAYGGPHAEVEAINSIDDKALLSGATVYVNLEPCSHFGKTPPCANMLAAFPLKRVVFSQTDPNPEVSGRGAKVLEDAGIETSQGLLSHYDLNTRFFTYHKEARPYVILKWAQTADGFIARENYDSKWISGKESRKLVHKWRSEEQAIMVGANTVRHDNPALTVRDWKGKNPIRVLVDPDNSLDASFNVFDKEAPTLIYNTKKSAKEGSNEYVKVNLESILKEIFDDLHKRNIISVFIEGGGILLNSILQAGLWDEARVFQSETRFEKGILAPVINQEPKVRETLLADTLFTYTNK